MHHRIYRQLLASLRLSLNKTDFGFKFLFFIDKRFILEIKVSNDAYTEVKI